MRAIAAAATVLLLSATVPTHANDGHAFEAGVEAARAGDYETALQHFQEARGTGVDTPALHFNIGVSLFQLGRLSEAAEAFRVAADSAEMGAPAAYNLGRIARQRGDIAAARRWFQRAARRAKTESVRAQALSALASDAGVPEITISGSVGTGFGHDDNIALVPTESARTSRKADQFAIADAFVHASLPRDWYLFGGAYTERYSDADQFDFSTVYAGTGRRLTVGNIGQTDHRLSARHSRFDGEPFEYGLMWDSRWFTDALEFEVGLEALRGASGYGHLDGHGSRLAATWTDDGLGGAWSLRYALSQIARNDLDSGDDFYSYSYYRNVLSGEIEWHIGNSYRVTVDTSWSSYRYADPEVRDSVSLGRRADTITQIGTRIEYSIADDWTLSGRLKNERRNSNLDQFDYQRRILTLRIFHEF